MYLIFSDECDCGKKEASRLKQSCGDDNSDQTAPIELNFVLPDRHNFAGIFHLVKLHVQFDVLVCQDDFAVFETTFAP